MKVTLVLHSHHGVLSAYTDESLEVEVLVDESEDYHEGLTDMPYYWLDVDIAPKEVARTAALADRFDRRMAARSSRDS